MILVLKSNPSHAPTYYNRGTTNLAAGNLERAIADFTKAISLNPKYAEAYYNRAVAHNKNKQYLQAIEKPPKGDRTQA